MRDIVRQRLQELDIRPNKKLGQNFLISSRVIESILKAVESTGAKALIEVGPGLGALTDKLGALGADLTLMELDRTLVQYWQNRGFQVISGDALQVDWEQFATSSKVCLVSNLPYQISSSIVIDRSLGPDSVDHMVLMFQKEVAQRIQSAPSAKTFGLLSVMAQSFWKIKTVCEAGAGAFYPPPQISSRVLSFERTGSSIVDRKGYLAFVKAGFALRRKQVAKSLIAFAGMRWGRSEFEVMEALAGNAIKPTQRAEEISTLQWQNLYMSLSQSKV